MEKYNCVIVEDEPLGAEILEGYINQIPFLKIIKICPDAISALNVLQKEKVDLLFLDIHLPKIKGLDFLKTLINPPKVIITTAYHEYALQGYEYNVLDYLLKPIEFNRFLSAVNKLKSQVSLLANNSETVLEKPHVYFNVNKKKVKINLEDILFIEGQKEYIKIVTNHTHIVTKFPIGQLHEILPETEFIRIHRSFVVSRKKIDAYSSTDVEIKGKQIPIGRSYKELVHNQISIEKK